MTGPPTLVIGAGGLLGGNVVQLVSSAMPPPVPIPWATDPTPALVQAAAWLGGKARRGQWRVAWCAGAGTVGTPAAELAVETRSLRSFLTALASSCTPANGAFFLASSAGGVHAGSTDDPITEDSVAAPISPYGWSKVEQEGVLRAWSEETGVPSVIGRLSNLYGPGQNLAKQQGLVSRLVRASLRAEPITVFVPLDTVRDYLFAPDAAARIASLLHRAVATRQLRGDHTTVKLIASGRGITVGELIADLRRIRKRRPPIVFGLSAMSRFQPRTLRFRSDVWPDLDSGPQVTLAEGLAAVVRDQERQLALGTSQRTPATGVPR